MIKAICAESDIALFQNSPIYKKWIQFLQKLSQSVVSMKISDEYEISDTVKQIESVLNRLCTWVDEIPPIAQPMRFGNKAFRIWHEKVTAEDVLKDIVPKEYKQEIACYLYDSFGNPTRVDYGTGHETNFVLFLYCLHDIGCLNAKDLTATVLVLYTAYMKLMRKLQSVYMLEPAGSKGVWGLDDYQCLTFYFGAAQLIDHLDYTPNAIHVDKILDKEYQDYLYFDAIRFIKKVKQGTPFAHAAPMLNDISGVAKWSKVHSGMLKLYKGEVISKLPVLQHIRFGTIFNATW